MSSIQDLVEARLLTYDPTLDTSDGSPARVLIIEPLAAALGAEALETDAADFIHSKLAEAFPELTLSPGDALTDILVNASSVLLEPYRAEISRVERSQSLLDPASMSAEDVDALASNWLVDRQLGARARVSITVTFERPLRFPVSPDVVFSTNSGLLFRSDVSYTLTADDVRDGQGLDGLYRVTLTCVADTYGAVYNVSAGSINSGTGLPPYASLTNESPARGGLDEETNVDFAARISAIANERSLVSDRGIRAKVLSGEFATDVQDVSVIGFGDDEMLRDALSATSPGTVMGSGLAVPLGRICVLLTFQGEPSVGDTVELTRLGTTERTTHMIEDVSPLVEEGRLPQARTFVVSGIFGVDVALYGAVLTAPPSAQIGTEQITPELHLGGKSDVYLLPAQDEADTFEGVPSLLNGFSGTGVHFRGGNRVTLMAEPSGSGDYLVVESGLNEGAYRILRRDGLDLWLDAAFDEQEASYVRYRLLDQLSMRTTHSVDQILPRPGEGEYLVTLTAGSDEVAAPGVSDLVLQDDTLEVLDLSVQYSVSGVDGDTIKLATPSRSTGIYTARVTRPRESAMLRGIAHIDQVSVGDVAINHSYSLNAEVLTATEPTRKSAGQVGRVLPHYHLVTPLVDAAIAADVNEFGYELLDGRGLDYQYSDGSAQPALGDMIFSYVWGDSSTRSSGEIALPADLFVPGPYTVAAVWGDLDVEELIRRLDAGLDIEPLLLSRGPQPAPASAGDVLVLNGESLVVDRAYPLVIRTDTADPNVVSRERAIRITVLRLRTHATPPVASAYESAYALTTAPDANQSITVRDLIALLARPEALLSAGNGVSERVNAVLTGVGFVPARDESLSTPVTERDTFDCELWEPARGSMKLYFHEEREVPLTRLWWPLYSTEEAAHYRDVGPLRVQPAPTRAGDLVPYGEGGTLTSSADPRMWPRDAQFAVAKDGPAVPISAPAAELRDGHGSLTFDTAQLTLSYPAPITLDLSLGDELHVLHESLAFESGPPTIVTVYLRLTEDPVGQTPSQILSSGVSAYVQDATGAPAAIDGLTLSNPYGQTLEGYLLSLPTTLTLALDDQTANDALSRRLVFYGLTSAARKYGVPAFHTVPGTGTLEAARLYESQRFDFPLGLTQDLVWVDSSEDKSDTADVIIASTSTTITLNRRFTRATGPVLVRGWGAVVVDDPTKLLIQGPSFLTTSDVLTEAYSVGDNYSAVGTGGTTRFLTEADVGRTITLLSSVLDPAQYENPALGAQVIREHLGTFVIQAVASEQEIDPQTNSLRTYRQTVTLDRAVTSDALAVLSARGEDHYASFFHVSDSVASSDLKTVVEAVTYHHEPAVYKIGQLDAENVSSEQLLYVTTRDDLLASTVPYGVFEITMTSLEAYNSAQVLRNPYAVIRPSQSRLVTSPDVGGLYSVTVPYRATTSGVVAAGDMLSVENVAEHEGYRLSPTSLVFAAEEDPALQLPPVIYGEERVDVFLNEVKVDYTHAPVVDQISAAYTTQEHRVVCSDLLFRRMLPCYIGVALTYEGGSAVEVIETDVRRFVRSSVIQGLDVSATELYALAHKRGASRVLTSARVFIVAVDRQRRRHIFFLEGPLSTALPSAFDGTLRITAPQVPTTSKLGVLLDIVRS